MGAQSRLKCSFEVEHDRTLILLLPKHVPLPDEKAPINFSLDGFNGGPPISFQHDTSITETEAPESHNISNSVPLHTTLLHNLPSVF